MREKQWIDMHVVVQAGARGRSTFSKVALGGSLLVNMALLSYYVTLRHSHSPQPASLAQVFSFPSHMQRRDLNETEQNIV